MRTEEMELDDQFPAGQSPRAVESREGRVFDVVLFGLTPPAAAVFLPAQTLLLARLPFRVGRLPVAGEAQPLEVNDLQLPDTKPFHVSRSHFAIERVPDGVQVRDRGSYLGTIVNRVQIGGHRQVGITPLAVGENEVVAGGPSSPFRFRVVVTPAAISALDLARRSQGQEARLIVATFPDVGLSSRRWVDQMAATRRAAVHQPRLPPGLGQAFEAAMATRPGTAPKDPNPMTPPP